MPRLRPAPLQLRLRDDGAAGGPVLLAAGQPAAAAGPAQLGGGAELQPGPAGLGAGPSGGAGPTGARAGPQDRRRGPGARRRQPSPLDGLDRSGRAREQHRWVTDNTELRQTCVSDTQVHPQPGRHVMPRHATLCEIPYRTQPPPPPIPNLKALQRVNYSNFLGIGTRYQTASLPRVQIRDVNDQAEATHECSSSYYPYTMDKCDAVNFRASGSPASDTRLSVACYYYRTHCRSGQRPPHTAGQTRGGLY